MRRGGTAPDSSDDAPWSWLEFERVLSDAAARPANTLHVIGQPGGLLRLSDRRIVDAWTVGTPLAVPSPVTPAYDGTTPRISPPLKIVAIVDMLFAIAAGRIYGVRQELGPSGSSSGVELDRIPTGGRPRCSPNPRARSSGSSAQAPPCATSPSCSAEGSTPSRWMWPTSSRSACSTSPRRHRRPPSRPPRDQLSSHESTPDRRCLSLNGPEWLPTRSPDDGHARPRRDHRLRIVPHRSDLYAGYRARAASTRRGRRRRSSMHVEQEHHA